MKFLLKIFTYVILILLSMDLYAASINLIRNQISTSNNPATVSLIAPINYDSVRLKIKAYNDDPLYRRTVYLDIDGIGGLIPDYFSSNITNGWIPPKSTRIWTINLNKTYLINAGRWGSYSPVESSIYNKIIDLKEMLKKPSEHKITCYVNVSEDNASGSTISLDIITSNRREEPAGEKSAIIKSDDTDDQKMKIALRKLEEITNKKPYNDYEFLIGKKSAESVIPLNNIKNLSKDSYVIKHTKMNGRTIIAISAEDINGTAYGVIKAVRLLKAYPALHDLNRLNMTMKPDFPIRVMYEERPWCHKDESPRYKAQLDKYFEETVNVADMWGLPLPPADNYVTDDYKYKQPYGDQETLESTIDYAHSLGIKAYMVDICQMNSFLDVPIEMTKNIDKENYQDLLAETQSGGYDKTMLCLSNDIALDLIKKQLSLKCKTTRNLDGFTAYFADPGGCWCDDCRPWGKTIIKALNELYAPVIAKENPKFKVTLSLWGVGINDVEYVIDHLNELPSCVTAIQIPPTSMEPNKYMTFESRVVPLIKQASKRLPVILQQFHDGVGFRDGWVDIWEHPMPHDIKTNLDNCNIPHGTIKGVYGSSFRLGDQLVDLRLGMDLGWNRYKNTRDILTEFGNEQFGQSIGKPFADAMSAMEKYWAQEVRRFHFEVPELSIEQQKTIENSFENATLAENKLRNAEKYVTGNRLYYKGFLELAELMRVVAQMNIASDNAWKSFQSGHTDDAKEYINNALISSERAVDLVSKSDRYNWLIAHPWWKVWAIGNRPLLYQKIMKVFDDSRGWGKIEIDDSSFESDKWETGGNGNVIFVSESIAGKSSCMMSIENDGDYAVVNSPLIEIVPNGKYKVTFIAKHISGNPSMYLDFSSGEEGVAIDGSNSSVDITKSDDWRVYTVSVTAPNADDKTRFTLRFVAVSEQKIMIDDVYLHGPMPK